MQEMADLNTPEILGKHKPWNYFLDHPVESFIHLKFICFSKYIDVDIYGACGTKQCPRCGEFYPVIGQE